MWYVLYLKQVEFLYVAKLHNFFTLPTTPVKCVCTYVHMHVFAYANNLDMNNTRAMVAT